MKKIIQLHANDNVAIVLYDVKALDVIEGDAICVKALEDIPYGHKIALTEIPANTPVYKYGEIIATSTCDITKGSWVHVHNVSSIRGGGK